MQAFETLRVENAESKLTALAHAIEQHVNQHWQTVFEANYEPLLDAYNRMGDEAYGVYCKLLFQPIHEQLKQAGLRATPKFPGNFSISREWGDAEDDRQRWFWSTVKTADGEAFGTIVTLFFHDHTQIRIPRAPQILALTETSKAAVVKALSNLSPDFAQAVEAKVEIAEYLRSLG